MNFCRTCLTFKRKYFSPVTFSLKKLLVILIIEITVKKSHAPRTYYEILYDTTKIVLKIFIFSHRNKKRNTQINKLNNI